MPSGVLESSFGNIIWTYPDASEEPPKPTFIYKKQPTFAEEIWISVKQYYRERGEPVPIADANACLRAIAEEKKPKPEPITDSKPSYSSGTFWKKYWAKKRASGWIPKSQPKIKS